MIRMIRNNSNFLPVIAGIALMTITACASANLGDFSKATQDAAIAAALKTAADEAEKAQDAAVDSVRAELECTTPVCDNVVNADDLPSYPTAAASNDSDFLTIVGTEIAIAGLEQPNGNALVASDINGLTRADICEARGGDEATCAPTKNTNTMGDGFRYFQGRFGDSGNASTFAGILPTTNLGAPLTAQPTTAVWPGAYSESGRTTASLDFNIDFANRRITTTTGNTLSFNAISFNLVFSDSGVISGAVLEHDMGTDTRIIGSRAATGLIGTEGLVGVFVNALDSQPGLRYLGGFVANNPDTNP